MTLDKLMPLFRIGDEPFLFSLPKKFKMSCQCNRRSLSPQAEQASTRKQHALAVLFGTALLSGLIILRSVHAENIKIGLPSVTITAMPFFVAKEHGFFQQEGLNAEMVVMPASLNIKVLLAGDIQYAATIGSAVAASIRDVNVRTIMLFVDRPLLDLVGAPGITSIAAMRGKLAGISSRRRFARHCHAADSRTVQDRSRPGHHHHRGRPRFDADGDQIRTDRCRFAQSAAQFPSLP